MLGYVWFFKKLVKIKVKGKKFEVKKSRKKVSFFFFSYLDWGKNTRIWMRNLNVDELLESCRCHLSGARLEEVGNSFGNFFQTFLTILRGKLSLISNNFFTQFFSIYIYFLVIFFKPNTRKKVTFSNFFFPPNFPKSKWNLNVWFNWCL